MDSASENAQRSESAIALADAPESDALETASLESSDGSESVDSESLDQETDEEGLAKVSGESESFNLETSEGDLETSEGDIDRTFDADGLPLSARISAIIFSSSRPLQIEALKRLTGAPFDLIEECLAQVKGLFSDEIHGFSLRQVAGGYQFRTAPKASETLRKLLPAKTRRLSRAAAETLAVIAYKQPVQRAEIEAIRGVDALPTVKTLLDQKLIRLVGHDQSIGQPALYATTELFLERFGLNDLSDLPSERELLQLDSEPGEVSEVEAASPVDA